MTTRVRALVDWGEDAAMIFDRFLPLISKVMPVRLPNSEFLATVVVDPRAHRGWVSDWDIEKVDGHSGIRVTGFWILLESDLSDALTSDITAGVVTKETEELGGRILQAIHAIHDAVLDFARNDHGHYWLPTRRPSDASLQQQLLRYDTRVEIPEGWKILRAEDAIPTITVEVMRGIEREDWAKFEAALASGRYKIQPYKRLMANALALHGQGDLRAAIVEAVAAWEMALGAHGGSRLAENHVAMDAQEWAQFIERAGLRASTRLLFALRPDLAGTSTRRNLVLEALDLRNNVVHNGQQRIDPGRCRALLRSLEQAIAACEGVAIS